MKLGTDNFFYHDDDGGKGRRKKDCLFLLYIH